MTTTSTDTPLATIVNGWPPVGDLVAQATAALAELAARANAPRVEDGLLREQIALHAQWDARESLGQEITAALTPSALQGHRDGASANWESAPTREVPKPPEWLQAISLASRTREELRSEKEHRRTAERDATTLAQQLEHLSARFIEMVEELDTALHPRRRAEARRTLEEAYEARVGLLGEVEPVGDER